MATHIAFRKNDTGEIKTVKVGWSWTLFFFGPVLGIPFWMRKAYLYAVAMIGWNILCLSLPDNADWSKPIYVGGGIGLALWLGRDGNKATAQYYLKHGWELAEPEAENSIYAAEKWALG